MDKTVTEVFGEFTYSQRLTYEDLINREQQLMEDVDKIFLEAGAEYIDFTPLGDILRVQCAFAEHDVNLFKDIAAEIGAILPKSVRGRLVCLEKNLESYAIFWISQGQWQEKEIIIPASAPEDIKTNTVKSNGDRSSKKE